MLEKLVKLNITLVLILILLSLIHFLHGYIEANITREYFIWEISADK